MRILMFGWEFPPHISGGLGTACYGMTQALSRIDTQILFVIPRADLQTAEDRVNMINASKVGIPVHQQKTSRAARDIKSSKRQTGAGSIITIPVHSGMSPYTTLDATPILGLSQWNYQVPVLKTMSDVGNKTKKVFYPFSGTYGPGLLEE